MSDVELGFKPRVKSDSFCRLENKPLPRAARIAIPGIFWRMAVQPAQELIRLVHFFTCFIEVHALQSFDMPLLETCIFIRDVEEADQPAEISHCPYVPVDLWPARSRVEICESNSRLDWQSIPPSID